MSQQYNAYGGNPYGQNEGAYGSGQSNPYGSDYGSANPYGGGVSRWSLLPSPSRSRC